DAGPPPRVVNGDSVYVVLISFVYDDGVPAVEEPAGPPSWIRQSGFLVCGAMSSSVGRGGEPDGGAAAAGNPGLGQGGGECVLGAPAGAVAWHDEVRVELGQRCHGRRDHRFEGGPGEV